MSERAIFLRSLAIGVVVGLMIAASSYFCAYRNLHFRFENRGCEETWRELKGLREALDDFQAKSGHYPERLEDLDRTYLSRQRIRPDFQVVDAWERPYEYRRVGDGFVLRSLGRDGRPGGVGLDEDIDSAGGTVPVPTLRQFTFELDTGNVQLYCGLLGLIVLVVCIRERLGAPENTQVAIIPLPIVTLMTIWMSSVMSFVHVPRGH